jgi:hypothetical protein
MDNCFRWGQFELPILLGILRNYLPREIEFYEVLIEGTIERCISLDDIEMICRAIVGAFEDGIEVERLSPLAPRAKMMLEQIDRLKLDDARD